MEEVFTLQVTVGMQLLRCQVVQPKRPRLLLALVLLLLRHLPHVPIHKPLLPLRAGTLYRHPRLDNMSPQWCMVEVSTLAVTMAVRGFRPVLSLRTFVVFRHPRLDNMSPQWCMVDTFTLPITMVVRGF